ncbi:hypothetical protein G9C85_06895 [Halorubellus sp. JP-L1]|uniref:hypothetical protein n=1 Tax=Halorubellus sp. JP-L1 TaxID=2715753 RepID=UPI001407576D|nr:hypothetical protein [Halorubellus sp. JP-L1]NHN41364.1 hypothetical protein [Halorubellus sp. JP-L1]
MERLVGRLGAVLDRAAVEAAKESALSTLGERDAVDVVVEAFADRVLLWFGCEDALEEYDGTGPDDHLDVGALKAAY